MLNSMKQYTEKQLVLEKKIYTKHVLQIFSYIHGTMFTLEEEKRKTLKAYLLSPFSSDQTEGH